MEGGQRPEALADAAAPRPWARYNGRAEKETDAGSTIFPRRDHQPGAGPAGHVGKKDLVREPRLDRPGGEAVGIASGRGLSLPVCRAVVGSGQDCP